MNSLGYSGVKEPLSKSELLRHVVLNPFILPYCKEAIVGISIAWIYRMKIKTICALWSVSCFYRVCMYTGNLVKSLEVM